MPFLSNAEIVIKSLNKYLLESASGDKPVTRQTPVKDLIRDLDLESPIKTGGLAGHKLSKFLDNYLGATTRLHHPAYMAHQVSVPHYAGALGSLIDGVTNNPMAIYEMGPAAASIEFFLINWMLEKIGWQQAPASAEIDDKVMCGGGVLTHGGSLANLTALIAARNRLAPDAWQNGNPADLAVLAPAGSHYSIARAVGILGIGQKSLYQLDVDKKGSIVPDKLITAHERMTNDGRRAVALVANACSTAVGIYDPLDEIGVFCKTNKIWFHVDGAHGASALLSQKHRHLLKGIEKADSVTWDAHKMLRVPVLCAALLVRNHRDIDHAFSQEASYLFHDKEKIGFDFLPRAIECTKAAMGLKLYMVLASLGERGLADYIDRQVDLANKAYEYLNGLPDISCPVKPQSNILCFRVEGPDALQLKIRDRLIAEGSFHISTTMFNGTRYLRLALMNQTTGLNTIKKMVQRIRELYRELGSPPA
jgi:L-2,4-diaminobutyrate decarboxylase